MWCRAIHFRTDSCRRYSWRLKIASSVPQQTKKIQCKKCKVAQLSISEHLTSNASTNKIALWCFACLLTLGESAAHNRFTNLVLFNLSIALPITNCGHVKTRLDGFSSSNVAALRIVKNKKRINDIYWCVSLWKPEHSCLRFKPKSNATHNKIVHTFSHPRINNNNFYSFSRSQLSIRVCVCIARIRMQYWAFSLRCLSHYSLSPSTTNIVICQTAVLRCCACVRLFLFQFRLWREFNKEFVKQQMDMAYPLQWQRRLNGQNSIYFFQIQFENVWFGRRRLQKFNFQRIPLNGNGKSPLIPVHQASTTASRAWHRADAWQVATFCLLCTRTIVIHYVQSRGDVYRNDTLV